MYDSILFHKTVKELLQISEPVANRSDYIQGAGGNTSCKSEDGLMAIKASGFELRQLNSKGGYAFVETSPIAAYFKDVDTSTETDFESQSKALISQHTITLSEWPSARPSMETGFHSVLLRYVIHTHSVYSNLINCRVDAESCLRIFSAKYGFECVFVPYLNPGFWLSSYFGKLVSNCVAEEKPIPQVYFLQNHGLVVTANSVDEANALHRDINLALEDFFVLIPGQYPSQSLVSTSNEQQWLSGSRFITDFFWLNQEVNAAYFEKNVLFPDQTVFFNNNFSFSGQSQKKIHVDGGQVIYNTSFKEARTIDETLTAYLFIRHQLRHDGVEPNFLSQADLAYINNMESEKFRKSLLK
jgi:ribulose-5-phosphate 4-epimerase/fuculose-1-phosphate aldolase